MTPELFELADNAEKMQRQSVETVREIIRPCGLSPTKSKNIVALSRQLVLSNFMERFLKILLY